MPIFFILYDWPGNVLASSMNKNTVGTDAVFFKLSWVMTMFEKAYLGVFLLIINFRGSLSNEGGLCSWLD